ncbi:MAG: hypothetical protein P8Y80_16505 [Acidobacteriota bacterium]
MPITICSFVCFLGNRAGQSSVYRESLVDKTREKCGLPVIAKTGIDFFHGSVLNTIYFKPKVFVVIRFENHIGISIAIDIDQIQQ